MSKTGPLIIFGITLTVGGLYWSLWDASRSYLDNILIEDVYYELMYWGFRMIPAVMVIIGIMCLIAAGISMSQKEVVQY